MPTVATGVVTLTSERVSFDTWPERNRKAPTTLNLIVPRPAAGLKTYLSSVNFAFSPSARRVLSLKVTSSRAAVPVDTVSLRTTDVLRASTRVAPLRVPLASPCMRLTVPIASWASTRSPAKTERSVIAMTISQFNTHLFVRATIKTKSDITQARTQCRDVRFSNRPFGVKRFQTIHQCSVDVARGLALLFGIGTKALPSWGSRTRRNNLLGGLVVRVTAGPSGHTNSPHPSSREGHHSTAWWSSSVLLSDLILHCHAAAASCRVQRNSVPSTQMRCMITASRRASATIAFFRPQRLATCIAQALSQDHRVERTSMIWAAS